jgi:circadian clock protein KaiB
MASTKRRPTRRRRTTQEEPRYVLRLYVTGTSRTSARAIRNIKAICDRHLPGRYDLEVIDLYEEPDRAIEAGIVAAPTLVKRMPLPLRRFIGDLSNEERILKGLVLRIS